jgi:hypothetical protein
MISLTIGQKVIGMEVTVVTGGNYNEEDNVLVVNDNGQESFLQAYYIVNGVVYAQKDE